VSEQPEPLSMRASDADRERVAQVLHQAMADGRLSTGELDERLSQLYRTRTFGELVPLTEDLPDGASALPAVSRPAAAEPSADAPRVGGTPGSTGSVAVMSQVVRDRDWVVPAHYSATAFWGEVVLDLREATFEDRECTIQANSIMAGIRVIVPPELTVRIEGTAVMGDFQRRAEGAGAPGSPVVVVTGFALMGAVDVVRKPRRGGLLGPR
jgi:hypothetical protein